MPATNVRCGVLAILFQLALATAIKIGCKDPHDAQQLQQKLKLPHLPVFRIDHVKMRDGVRLHTNVLLPHDARTIFNPFGKQYPIVLDRSPYGGMATELLADIYLPLGFGAVGQDMRGTCKSEGNFSIWRKDSVDGYDTMEWISKQPWSNGKIFTIGASADGIASLLMPLEQPKWLKAQFVIVATIDAQTTVYPGGAYRQGLINGWLRQTVPSQADDLIADLKTHEGASSWWNSLNASAAANWDKIKAPAVMFAGWYDIFLQGNLNGFYIYQHLAAEKIRGKSFLVVDPLGHCQEATKYFPGDGLLLGRKAISALLSIQMFRGEGNIKQPAEGVKKISFFVMGPSIKSAEGNFWTSVDEWPTYTPLRMYLHAGGELKTERPTAADSSSFVYDPNHPVPTVGGNNLEVKPCGPKDQRTVEERSDVLVHTSDTLADSMAITGPLLVSLQVSSNCTDTDFTAKLTDVYPDGTSRLLQDGIIRMRWRQRSGSGESLANPELIVPAQKYNISINLWNTSYIFNSGHKIRLTLSSSNAPRFKPNPNLGLPLADEDNHAPKVAENTVWYDNAFVELPLVKASQLPRARFLLGNETQMEKSALKLSKYVDQAHSY